MTPYRHAATGVRVPRAALQARVRAHARGLGVRLWMRERRRREAIRALVVVGVTTAWPDRVRALPDANGITILLLAVLGAGLLCICEFDPMPRRSVPATSRPLVTWRQGQPRGAMKEMSIDGTGHYEAGVVWTGFESSRETGGQLPPLEMARLQHELGEVSWGRATWGGCEGSDCETLTVGEGERAVTVSRASFYGQSPWASEELQRVFTHLGELYEGARAQRAGG